MGQLLLQLLQHLETSLEEGAGQGRRKAQARPNRFQRRGSQKDVYEVQKNVKQMSGSSTWGIEVLSLGI